MRIRVDGNESPLLVEAKLALRHAGFIVAELGSVDYTVTLAEAPRTASPHVVGTEGVLERLIVSKLLGRTSTIVLARAERPNDAAATITVPASDFWRRAVSRILVEIFLSFLTHEPTAWWRRLARWCQRLVRS